MHILFFRANIALMICSCLCLSQLHAREETDISLKNSPDCGATVLHMIYFYYGMKYDYLDLINELNVSNKGNSLLDLKQHVIKNGLFTSSKRFKSSKWLKVFDNYEQPIFKVVSYKNHFVVVVIHDKQKIKVIDPRAGKAYFIGKNEFEKNWNRIALLISAKPIPSIQMEICIRKHLITILLLVAITFIAVIYYFMKKRTFIMVLLIVCGLANSVSAFPRIWLDKTDFDLGTFRQGEIKKVICTVHNLGDSRLTIFEIKKPCVCTNVEINKDILENGESAILEITINTGTDGDGIDTELRICSDDPIEPETKIRIHGMFKLDHRVYPERLFFYNLLRNENGETRKIYVNKDQFPELIIDKVIPSSSYLFIDLSHIAEEKEFVTIGINNDYPDDCIDENVKVYFKGTEDYSLVNISGAFRKLYHVLPSVLFLGTINTQELVHKEIIVSHNLGREFRIERAYVSSEAIKIRIREISLDKYKIELSLIHVPMENSYIRDSLKIIVQEGKYSEILEVPIIGKFEEYLK